MDAPTPENFKGLFLSDPGAAKWQYTNGVPDPTLLDPSTWVLDQVGLERPDNAAIQLDMLYDYRTNLLFYPKFPRVLSEIPAADPDRMGEERHGISHGGALPYKRDLPEAEIHLLDTGHFALETHGHEIVGHIVDFFGPRN